MDKVIPVRVALRCRPLIPKEKNEGCETCLQFIPGEEQVILGQNKSFTFDYVFTPDTPQVEVYERAVSHLVEGIFKGYNATVLAYGQTGSGKTFSMGGGYGISLDTGNDIVGIIPRVIRSLFEGIEEHSEYTYIVRVSYLEIYKEDLLDLLHPNVSKDSVTIREFDAGTIKLVGLTERTVESPQEMLKCLTDGANNRTTAATAMNTESSRSHAIFTVYIDRTSKKDSQDFTRSKFHLVDLAGSERQKKTKAEGERLKEGININKGLLALGNVISALGDEAQRAKYVPYRDSKLTRLLQDSLGGNSHTVMIACCSPADSNMEETLSTLRYADRARKIKNKPVVNRDPQVAEIMRLRNLVRDLQMQMINEGIPIKNMEEGTASSGEGDSSTNNLKLVEENKILQAKIKELEAKNTSLQMDLDMAWEQGHAQMAKIIMLEGQKEAQVMKLDALKELIAKYEEQAQNEREGGLVDMTKSFCKTFQEHVEEMENIDKAEFEKLLNETQETGDTEVADTDNKETEENETMHENDTTTGLNEFQREAQKKHEENKAQLFRNLNDLNKRLMEKEQLVKNMEQSDGIITKMRSEFEENIKTKESEINKLQAEKDELEAQLKQSKVDANLGKVNEMRRKKIQELETQLKEQTRALMDTKKVLKVKESSTKDMERLKRDIVEMKQQRVKLMKQIKADNEQFRKFKQQKDKEVIQLKALERKRMVELKKIKGKFELQQAVLKRKNEETVALSKRLHENLQRQRRAQEDKAKKDAIQSETKKTRIQKLLNQELELVVGVEEARQQKEDLVKDRKTLSESLAHMKDELEILQNMPAVKKQQLNDSSAVANDDKTRTLRQQIRETEAQIQIKTSYIHDLQNKIMEADQHANDKHKKPFYDELRSMTEYRIGMNYLISKVKSSRMALIKQQGVNEDLSQENEDIQQKLSEKEEEICQQKQVLEDDKLRLLSQYETKVAYLLAELKRRKSARLSDEMEAGALSTKAKSQDQRFLHEELEAKTSQLEDAMSREQTLRQEMTSKDHEIEDLRKELTKKAYKARTNQNETLMPRLNETITYKKGEKLVDDEEEATFFSEAMLKTPAVKKHKRRTLIFEEETSEEETEDDQEYEETEAYVDPDWIRGRTPGAIDAQPTKRARPSRAFPSLSGEALSSSIDRSSIESNTDSQNSSAIKPDIEVTSATPPTSGKNTSLNSPNVRCSCKGACATKRCACFKADGRCSDYCKCTQACENRELQVPESTTNDEEDISHGSTMMNTTFVKEDDLSQEIFRDTTNTTHSANTTASTQEELQQPRKFRKSGDRTREPVRISSEGAPESSDQNSSTSDLSQEGLAKPIIHRKRKLGKKTSQYFNPV